MWPSGWKGPQVDPCGKEGHYICREFGDGEEGRREESPQAGPAEPRESETLEEGLGQGQGHAVQKR